jgi:glycolate oxidase
MTSILRRLEALGLGERLLTRPAQLAPFASDGLAAFSERPVAVVLAESTSEVIDAIRACSATGVPFVARGSGTSLSGGAVPAADGIVIALNRLNRVRKVDAGNRLAVVEPGVINAQVSAVAAPFGLYYAPDPSSQSVCTIGGNLAFNSGGAHCLRHGMTSNHVIGLRVVLPEGEVVELGGDYTEDTGPDWTGMFCGSEGLFGVAIEATLRLIPVPEATRTSLASYDSLRAAGEAVALILSAGLLPVAMEIMDALAITAAEASVKPCYPPCEALLIVEIEGEREVVQHDGKLLDSLLAESGATTVKSTEDPRSRALIWRGRKSAFSAVGWLSPDYLVQDGVVPRTRLGEALAEIERLSREAGLRVANVFHAGDGNLHPLILYDGRQDEEVARAHDLSREVLALCVSLGGSITGEHGVGLEKRTHLSMMFSEADLDFMHRIRRSVDPGEIANRGKMLEPRT